MLISSTQRVKTILLYIPIAVKFYLRAENLHLNW